MFACFIFCFSKKKKSNEFVNFVNQYILRWNKKKSRSISLYCSTWVRKFSKGQYNNKSFNNKMNHSFEFQLLLDNFIISSIACNNSMNEFNTTRSYSSDLIPSRLIRRFENRLNFLWITYLFSISICFIILFSVRRTQDSGLTFSVA